jgi:adenylate kinase
MDLGSSSHQATGLVLMERDNTILYRRSGRAATFRKWGEQGRVEEEQKRARLRAAVQARVEKHKVLIAVQNIMHAS